MPQVLPASLALLENGDWGNEERCPWMMNGVLQGAKKFVADAAVARLFVVVSAVPG